MILLPRRTASSRSDHRGRQRLLATALLGAAALALAACGGSQVSPKQALAAQLAISGEAGSTGQQGAAPAAGDGGSPLTGTGQNPAANTGGAATAGAATGGSNTVVAPASGGSGGNGSTGSAGTPASAGIAVKAGSCAGLKNQTGIDAKTITIGNSSDISGPIPGLFTATQQATAAYVAYFNATSSICGRKLALLTQDSRTDAGADQQAYQKLCESTFAAVGSMSVFDSGGAQTAQSCGLPDLRTASVTATRNACTTCFGAQSTGPFEASNAIADFSVKNYRTASQHAAFLYINAGAAAENAKTQIAVAAKRGMKFLYTSPIDVADFNYGPYVQQLKSRGVQWVEFIGAYQQTIRFTQAMQAGAYKPQVFMMDPSVYDQNYITSGGSSVEGTIVYINFTPFEESQPELDLYKQWLQQVAPGAVPTFFGEFAWSAAKLFVQEAIRLGGKLTRASMVAAIRGVNNWTGGGMHGPMSVGSKHAPSCVRFLQVRNGRFVPLGGTRYLCDGYSSAR